MRLNKLFLPLLLGGVTTVLSLACATSDPNPTTGDASTRSSGGRLLAASETGTSVYVIDLEQGVVEASAKSVLNSAEMVISPEGRYAFLVQPSGNRVDVMKVGTSVSASSGEESSELDEHGHDHGKPRFSGDHDHGSESSSDSSGEESSSSSSSVDQVDISITGEGLGDVIARGKWVATQFAGEVVVIAEDDLENNKSNSISETIDVVHKITTAGNRIAGFPGVPMDEEHIAIGNWVFEIEDNTTGANLFSGNFNAAANALLSSNILSATRSGEGTALFGTDQGLLIVGKHTESGNVEWVDLLVDYPVVAEANIFLAGDHDHEKPRFAGGDEHEEVEENRAATEWATMDGLGHAFVHLTHEDHSAGIYLVEAEGLEADSFTGNVFEYLPGTSSNSSRPLCMSIISVHSEEEHHDEEEEEEEEEHEHSDSHYLLILMSSGNLRIHDAGNEGAHLKTLTSLISPVEDFHEGENNLPGMSAGFGKVFVGDPASSQLHQIDLESFSVELTWNLETTPNRILVMGESTMSEDEHGDEDDHDHD